MAAILLGTFIVMTVADNVRTPTFGAVFYTDADNHSRAPSSNLLASILAMLDYQSIDLHYPLVDQRIHSLLGRTGTASVGVVDEVR
jgi:hypothetical protein